MSFEIDIAGAPPTPDVIKVELDRATAERAIFRKRNIRFTVGLFAIMGIYVALVIKFVIPMMGDDNPDWGIITYFFPYFTFAIFVIGNHLHIKRIEKPSKALDKLIAGLKEASEEELSEAVKKEEMPAQISDYMQKVENLNRSLIHAELDAFQNWIDENSKDSN